MLALNILALVALSLPANAESAIERYADAIATAPVQAKADEKKGFRDLVFGQTCSGVPGFTMTKSVGDLQGFRRATDTMTIGEGDLTSIGYLCSDDKLRLAMVIAPDSSVKPIALALIATYGAPSLEREGFAYWRGHERTAWMAWGRDDGKVIVSMGALPWGDPIAMYKKLLHEQAQEGASDL
jgi:hypothetical protein